MKQHRKPIHALTLSSVDHQRIATLLTGKGNRLRPSLELLTKKLEKAEVVSPLQIAPNVVTMHSQVVFLETDTQDIYGFTLAYPGRGNRPGEVSVFTPVGAALLGLSVGQEIHWWSKNGRRLGLHVLDVVYQPEAEGIYDA